MDQRVRVQGSLPGPRGAAERGEVQDSGRLNNRQGDLATVRKINHLQRSKRNQSEDWAEWTISAGYGFSVGPASVLYTGLLTMGTGQPGVVSAGWSGTARSGVTDAFSKGDFLPAPSGSLNVREALIWTHMVSISYRIE